MNNRISVDESASPVGDAPELTTSGESASQSPGNHSTESSGLRAIITTWEVLDQAGDYNEVFRTGDDARIQFYVDVVKPVHEIQAGILLRTVEGVTVFGTSTLYHDKNYLNAKSSTTLQFSFDLNLVLCAGTYFVTLAIADAISHGDMTYLDRKTDVIVLKVSETHTLGSGIAALKSSVSVNTVRNS
jgi:lipopolysaccharide transport system ATP-binding protein